MSEIIPLERIKNKILIIRSRKMPLDRDLAELYGIETKQLKRQVRRNIERFPKDFLFAFSEQGVAMLSSVLNNQKAILVNIAIMRAFVLDIGY